MSSQLRLFDAHCHLQAEDFDGDRDAVIVRARDAGVRRVLAVAEDLADCHRVLDLAADLPGFVVPALGVHPDRAAEVTDAEVADVVQLTRENASRLGAIGEVGLDFRPRWDDAAKGRQRDVFRTFVALARELGLPLSVHSRSAGHHAVTLLRDEDARAACLHAFDGRVGHALRGAEAGFVFSLPPSIVRSQGKQSLARLLPVDALLLESDSPVLGPVPQERNEPANLRVALREIARLRSEDEAVLAGAFERVTARTFPRLVGPS